MRLSRGWLIDLALMCLVLLLSAASDAYELDTHEELSLAAFEASDLRATLRTRYGIQRTDTFELRPSPFRVSSSRKTAEDWIAKGGRDEDEPLWRVLNHFYDPYHDEPLGVLGGARAPDWALEDRGDFLTQRHSFKDARAAFYQGLTASDPLTREQAWAHTFYALGHVIHLIQDMAQPQHARNDAHFFLGPAKSWMEAYVDDNRLRFVLTGAALPAVTRVRDLWASGGGAGLAELANAHFVSAGTNFTALRTGATAERFPSPILDLADTSAPGPADTCKDGTPAPGDAQQPLTFYGNTFADPASGATLRNARMTTHSIFDEYLHARGLAPIFALNCFNLDAAADLLLPRAVASSASLLRYFFRGDLEVATEANSAGYVLRVTNRTPGEALSGSVALHYESSDGTRKLWHRWEALTLAPDQTSGPLLLPTPPPDQAEPGRYLLVFRGQLGEEPGAVVARWIGAGVYFVELWYDDYYRQYDTSYPAEGGIVDFVPVPLLPWWDNALSVTAHASHTMWRFYCCDDAYHGGGGESRAADVTDVLTTAGLLPGSTATLRFHGRCYGGGGIEPVVADLVALELPRDLAALEVLTWSTQPAVARVLHRVSSLAWDWSGAETATVDLGGATFLGLRLVSVPVATPPPPPPPFPPFTTSSAECRMDMRIQPQPPP